MKTLFYIVVIIMVLSSCNKELGTVHYNIRFTTEDITLQDNSLKSTKLADDDLHHNFGDYITSITPTKFIAKIWTIGYCDRVEVPNTNEAQNIQFIDGSPEHVPDNSPLRIIDFSGNVTVNFENPVMFGNLKDGILAGKNINFIYFYFLPFYLYQEIPLPEEYKNVTININNRTDVSVENNILKTNHCFLMKPLFPNQLPNFEVYFYFGNTDSTFVVNPNQEEVPLSENNPIMYPSTHTLIIRSHKYVSTTYSAPDEGETITLSGVVSFNTTNLIQVYAGADNIPYTSDDVFVYAPKFWERISSR